MLSTIKIRVTTRVQIVVGIVTVAIILIVDVVTTAKGGAHGQALSAFSFSHTLEGGFSGVFYGIILGVTSYIGFETAADFGEETANPRRNIPIAIIVATAFVIIFYLWTTYAIDHRVRRQQRREVRRRPGRAEDHRRPRSWAPGSAPWSRSAACARRSSCAWPAPRPPPAPCSRWAGRACCRAAFGRTHPRFKTPVNATLAVTAVAIVMALLVGYPFSDAAFGAPFSNYYFWATVGTLLIIVVYILVCLGGITFFWQTRDSRKWNPIAHVAVPVIGAVVFAAAWYGSVHPTPPGILKWTPFVAVVWLVARPGGAGLAAGAAAPVGGDDRLHPRRGGRQRRGRARQVTRPAAIGRRRRAGPAGSARRCRSAR